MHAICNWHNPPSSLKLAHTDVHVWRTPLDQSSPYMDTLAQFLAKDEHTRAERFYFERDRQRFIVGRGVLRMLIGYYLNQHPASLIFHYGRHGKPTLDRFPTDDRLCFNVSHSHELALFAFAWNTQVGIDVEHLRPIARHEHIAKRFFSPQEQHALASLPPHKRSQGFFNCWTRKEAYLKARGVGLSNMLKETVVSLLPDEPAHFICLQGDTVARWHIQALTPADGYVGALVVEGSNWNVRCFEGNALLWQTS